MSFGEPAALRGQTELERAGIVAAVEVCPSGETQFLERLKAREPAAFDRLVQERSGEVYALLCRLLEDSEEAKDLTQETFLRAFQSIGRFRGESDIRTWLYRIAVNQARNRWRWWKRRKKGLTISLDDETRQADRPLGLMVPKDKAPDPEQQTLAREREQALREALRKLGRAYREVVVLRDVEGLSYEEVAATLNLSVGTVKSRLSRGRLELRRRLEGCF